MKIRVNYFNRNLVLIIPLVGIVIVGVFLISYGITDLSQSFKLILHGIVMTAGLWLGCMTIVMFLWKRFPWEYSPLSHLLIEIFLILIYTLTYSYLLYYLEKRFWNLPQIENLGIEIFVTILITYFITAVHESVFFYQQWKFNFSRTVRLEKDNIEAKYEALRAQINPHFLFNSLNSLTNMVHENKPVVDYIQNLSSLLRYMLKSGESELVLLSEELEITMNYINLQLMRFNGSLEIKVTIPDGVLNHAVPPLVLQMLIENSLKHNIISKEKPLRVEVFADDDYITVINKLQRKQGVTSTGQGIENIKGRYGFFTTRKVEVSETDEIFKVKIPLLKAEL